MKVVKRLEELASFLLVFAGLVVCMCETAELDKQIMTLGIGVGMIAAGVVMGFFTKGKENVYSR